MPQVLPADPPKIRSIFRIRRLFSVKSSAKAEPISTDAANSVGIMLATAQRVVLDPKITESVRSVQLLLPQLENADKIAVLVRRVS